MLLGISHDGVDVVVQLGLPRSVSGLIQGAGRTKRSLRSKAGFCVLAVNKSEVEESYTRFYDEITAACTNPVLLRDEIRTMQYMELDRAKEIALTDQCLRDVANRFMDGRSSGICHGAGALCSQCIGQLPFSTRSGYLTAIPMLAAIFDSVPTTDSTPTPTTRTSITRF